MNLRLNGASYSVGTKTLVDAIDLDISPGRLTAIVGPNGAGKSTALKLLAGDLKPDEGTAEIGDKSLSAYSARELACCRAVMPQATRPAFGFKVWELVQTGRAPFNENDRTTQHHSEMALSRVNAIALADRNVATLSGGEKQRIFLAKALCQLSGVSDGYLLLDEPTSALDLKQSLSVMRILRQITDSGVGVVVVLHDLAAARRYSDHICMLAQGRIHAQGPVADTLSTDNIATAFEVDTTTARDAVGVL